MKRVGKSKDRYLQWNVVGFGANSVVYKASRQLEGATEESQHEPLAVKKVENIFSSAKTAHKLLHEIKILRLLRGHPNVSFKVRSLINFIDLRT